jgi:diguanylate cyclase (GGDEF)-like protein
MSLKDSIDELQLVVKQLAEKILSDDKTPLGNALALREMSSLLNRENTDFGAIVFGDLNRFKGINDTFGHQAGDIAIKETGEKIKEMFVDNCGAKAFRQSGDEFVILFPAKNIKRFKKLAANFAEISFIFNEQPVRTAMSFGLVLIDEKSDFETLLLRAETACQQAKTKGDGKVVEWTEEVEKATLVNLRARCNKCGTKISCNVPKDKNPSELIICAFCGEPLTQ